jgi:redox-sensitive bicupin YhaK (pirin superfamily)
MPREVRRAAQRYVTDADDVRTLHSFSYGVHYDPANVGFGALQAINEERVDAGGGYDAHRHADVEIVTWVLEGALHHEDTTGHAGTVRPGTAQRLSAGSGAEHAERNASATEPLRFVQTMLRSRHEQAPEYASVDVPDGPGLHPAVGIHADAELLVARPDHGVALQVEPAPRALVHVTRGRVEVGGEVLGPGDELRAVGPGTLEVAGRGEALVWRLLDPT